jgi:predicted CXXCH cytochrome family protein
MRESAYSCKPTIRSRLLAITPGLLLVLLALVSCDEVKRHRMKTFFFDGVPPLPGQTPEAGTVDPNSAAEGHAFATGGWYVHEPLQDCTQCHVSRRRARFSREVQLVAEVPQLCFNCHEEYAALPGWVHGPVATGDCAFCHEPHKTRYSGLLTAPAPDLCYQCHEPEALALVENHAEPAYAQCLECHEAHAAGSRHLLRPVFLEGEAGRPYRSAAYRQQYERAWRNARSDWAQGRGAYAMLRVAIDHVEGGRLWEARAYLEVILEKAALSADEGKGIREVLSQVIGLLEGEPDARSLEPAPDSEHTTLSTALSAVRGQKSRREEAIARLYRDSIESFHAGRLAEARAGFVELLRNDAVTGPFRETAQQFLVEIEKVLGRRTDER